MIFLLYTTNYQEELTHRIDAKEATTKLRSAITPAQDGQIIDAPDGKMLVVSLPSFGDTKGLTLTLPAAFYSDEILSKCFPGKPHSPLRQFFAVLMAEFGGTNVKEGSGQINNSIDDAAIAALINFQETESKTVLDLGCGNGIMTMAYILAGAKKIYSYDLLASSDGITTLLKAAYKLGIIDPEEKIALHVGSAQIQQAHLFDVNIFLCFGSDLTTTHFSFNPLIPSNSIDQIWAGRFWHILNTKQMQTLYPKVMDCLAAGGSMHSVVNTVEFLWNSRRFHPKNREIAYPLKQELNKSELAWPFIRYFLIDITLKDKHKVACLEATMYEKTFDEQCRMPNIPSCAFFTKEMINRMNQLFGLKSRMIRYLEGVGCNFTDDENRSIQIYSHSQKITPAMQVLADEALNIPLNNTPNHDILSQLALEIPLS